MDYKELNEILVEYGEVEKEKIQNATIKTGEISIMRLRNVLIINGKILEEYLEKNLYIATVNGGLAKMSKAWVVAELDKDCVKLAVYAKEGLIKQNISQGVIKLLADALQKEM